MSFFWMCSFAASVMTVMGGIVFVYVKEMSYKVLDLLFGVSMFLLGCLIVYVVQWFLNRALGWHVGIQNTEPNKADFVKQSVACLKNVIDFSLNVTLLVYTVKNPLSGHGARHGIVLSISWGLLNMISTFVGKLFMQNPADAMSVFSSAMLSLISFCISDHLWRWAALVGILYIYIAVGVAGYYNVVRSLGVYVLDQQNTQDMKSLSFFYIFVFCVIILVMVPMLD
ncbi:hypothetical protein AQUCO_00500449v1 [Aquilegia coerulea]|uniref:Uncharacterized protein n=1 Tax=Aquilegia coerulea TaxID=218851 RepID=A0A2G5ERZ5_AQUCA|nr:hypothetical protein AQUCO_00500449v1 [Aquilegia coerulea]